MTRRALYTFLLIVITYVLANQSGVSWLFALSDVMLGLFVVSLVLPRFMLRNLSVSRTFGQPAEHDPGDQMPPEMRVLQERPIRATIGDPVLVSVAVTNTGFFGRYFVRITQAARMAKETEANLFIPALSGNQTASIDYPMTLAHRGSFLLPAPTANSGAPAGMYIARRDLDVPEVAFWVRPTYVEIAHFPLRQPENLPRNSVVRRGAGLDFRDIRAYQPGDSLNRIHWPLTARTGQLTVKEFDEESGAGVTILIDRHCLASVGQGVVTTYEYAVSAAASIARYTIHKGYPTVLAGQGRYSFPPKPVPWLDLLDSLTQAEADGTTALVELIATSPATSTFIVMVSLPSPAIITALLARQHLHRRSQTIAILFDADAFGTPPTKDARLDGWKMELEAIGILTAICRPDTNLLDLLHSLNPQAHRSYAVVPG